MRRTLALPSAQVGIAGGSDVFLKIGSWNYYRNLSFKIAITK